VTNDLVASVGGELIAPPTQLPYTTMLVDYKQHTPDPSRPDMGKDIESCEWMVTKIQASYNYAQHLYAAMCNNEFQRNDIIPILKDWTWRCSWRSAGGIVGEIRGGEYTDFYCSGPSYTSHAYDKDQQQCGIITEVEEGTITDEIRQDLFQLGWVVATSH
jgi:hypothetical protein